MTAADPVVPGQSVTLTGTTMSAVSEGDRNRVLDAMSDAITQLVPYRRDHRGIVRAVCSICGWAGNPRADVDEGAARDAVGHSVQHREQVVARSAELLRAEPCPVCHHPDHRGRR